MLLQSQGEEIELLPALPSAWPSGSVHGLCARGGFVVDIAWRSGELVSATITSRHGARALVRYRDGFFVLNITAGRRVRLQPGIFRKRNSVSHS